MPRAKSVEELRHTLLFNNTLEIWMALCAERGKDYRDLDSYLRFLDHLSKSGVKLDASVVCPPIKGISDKPPKAYNIKLDQGNIEKIKSFPS